MEESKSTVFLQEGPFEVNIGESNSMKEISLTKNIEEVNEEKTTKLKIKDTKKKGTIAPNNQNDPQNASVEIVIIRGWDASML